MDPQMTSLPMTSDPTGEKACPAVLPEFKRILLVTSLDDGSKAALAAAATLARASGGFVHVLCLLEATVCERPDPQVDANATQKLTIALEALRGLGVEEVHGRVEYGIAENVILRRADTEDFDVVVLGSTKHRRGTNAYVMAHARIPVMTTPCGVS